MKIWKGKIEEEKNNNQRNWIHFNSKQLKQSSSSQFMNFANDSLATSTAYSRYCLHSNHVWISERNEFTEAFIFVNGQIIQDVLFPENHKIQIENLRNSEYKRFMDYGEQYIFPGLIDSNVSLHLGDEWEDVEGTTELLSEGGVTTLVCQPLKMNEKYLRDELASIKNKKELISGKSAIDYCFLANIYPENIHQILPLRQETGVLGFKIYLQPPVQNGAGWVDSKKDMEILMKRINDLRIQIENEETSPDEKKRNPWKLKVPSKSLLIAFHSIKSGGKELTITSPLRQRKISDRCDRTTEIRRTAGDSIQGETTKSQKENEVHFNKYDQLEIVGVGDISNGINDNILNLKPDQQSSSDDEEEGKEKQINSEDQEKRIEGLPQEGEQKEEGNTSQDGLTKGQNEADSGNTQQQQQSSREKLLRIFAQATRNQTENLQSMLIARAERKEYKCHIEDNKEEDNSQNSDETDSKNDNSNTESSSSNSDSDSDSCSKSNSSDEEISKQTDNMETNNENKEQIKNQRRKTVTKTGFIPAKRERYRSCLVQNDILKKNGLFQAEEQSQSPSSIYLVDQSNSNSPSFCGKIQEQKDKHSEESTDDQHASPLNTTANRRDTRDKDIQQENRMHEEDKTDKDQENGEVILNQNTPHQIADNFSKSNELEGTNLVNTLEETSKTPCKFIKVQRIDVTSLEGGSHSSIASKEEQLQSLPKIDENVESAKDSDSDSKEEEEDEEDIILKLKSRRKAHSKNLAIPYDKRGSNDNRSIINQPRGEPHIRLIKDMKRGSCDKDASSFIADHYIPNKKSFFNLPNNQVELEKGSEQSSQDSSDQDNSQKSSTESGIDIKTIENLNIKDSLNDQRLDLQLNPVEQKDKNFLKKPSEVEDFLIKITNDKLDFQQIETTVPEKVPLNTKLRQQSTLSPTKDSTISPRSIGSDSSFLTASPNPQSRGIARTRFQEKRKSMNLSVHIDGQRFNKTGEGLMQHKSTQGLEENEEHKNYFSVINLQSMGLISRDELGSSLSQIEIQKKSYTSLDNPSLAQVQGSSPEECNGSGKCFKTQEGKEQQQKKEISRRSSIHNNLLENDSLPVVPGEKTIEQKIEEETAAAAKELISKSSAQCDSPLVHQQSLQDGRDIAKMIAQKMKEKNAFKNLIKSKFNQDYLTFLAFRPPYWEYFGISMIRDSIERHAVPSKIKMNILFQNIGNSNSMYRIMTLKEDLKSKARNVHLYSETTGAHLFFSSNKIHDGKTIFKSEPPIGAKENKEFLINASKLNMVDVVSSYHFPVEPRFKCLDEGDFRKAFNGLCTAGFTLQATWTALYESYQDTQRQQLHVHHRQLEEDKKRIEALLKYTANMLSTKPAKILNIYHMKGSIQKGKYADFVIWDPFASIHRTKVPSSYKFKKVHIFDKKRVYGKIHCTILRGRVIYQGQSTQVSKGFGRLITLEGEQ